MIEKNEWRDPYELPGVSLTTVSTTHEMNVVVEELLAEKVVRAAEESGGRLPVFLIAQVSSSIDPVKRWLAVKGVAGVEVVTFADLVRKLWGILGDGRAIATLVERRIHAKKALSQAMGRDLSIAAIDEATAALNILGGSGFSETPDYTAKKAVGIPARFVADYSHRLDMVNLVDVGDAAAILASEIASGRFPCKLRIVAEDPTENDFPQSSFYGRIAPSPFAEVCVIRREPSTFPLGTVVNDQPPSFGLACGERALPTLAASITSKLMTSGASPDSVVIALLGDFFPRERLLVELRRLGIPYEGVFDAPMSSFSQGIAILKLVELRLAVEAAGNEHSDNLVSHVVQAAFPRPSIDELCETVAALHPGLHDTEPGLMASYMSGAELSGDYPGKVVAILSGIRDGDLAQFVEEMFVDDALGKRIAVEVAGYLRACRINGELPDLDEISRMKVGAAFSWGEAPRIRVVASEELSYDPAPNIVMCGMDAKTLVSFTAPGPFAKAFEEAGRVPDAWQKKRYHRLQLVDALMHARGGGSLWLLRADCDKDGNELAPAPLLSEVAEALGGWGDDGFPTGCPGEKRAMLSEEEDVFARTRMLEEDAVSGAGSWGSPFFTPPRKDGRPHRFAPTELESYHCCPRKWFASRSGAGYPPPPPESVMDPRKMGSLAHAVLQGYYEKWGREHPREKLEDDSQALEEFRRAADAACHEELGEDWEETCSIEEVVCVSQVVSRALRFIRSDVDFLPGFSPTEFEQWLEGELWGLDIGGFADRIDVEENEGSFAVIDYKSSVDSSYCWNAEKDSLPLHIQGLIYARLALMANPSRRVDAVLYRDLSGKPVYGSSAIKPFSSSRSSSSTVVGEEGLERQFELLDEHMEDLGKRMRSGDVRALPLNGVAAACRFCPVWDSCPNYSKKD